MPLRTMIVFFNNGTRDNELDVIKCIVDFCLQFDAISFDD